MMLVGSSAHQPPSPPSVPPMYVNMGSATLCLAGVRCSAFQQSNFVQTPGVEDCRVKCASQLSTWKFKLFSFVSEEGAADFTAGNLHSLDLCHCAFTTCHVIPDARYNLYGYGSNADCSFIPPPPSPKAPPLPPSPPSPPYLPPPIEPPRPPPSAPPLSPSGPPPPYPPQPPPPPLITAPPPLFTQWVAFTLYLQVPSAVHTIARKRAHTRAHTHTSTMREQERPS